MAKAAKTRVKAPAVVYVPQTQDAVVADIKTIGDLSRTFTRTKTAMNDEIAAITKRYSESLMGLEGEIEKLQIGVQIWCDANRDKLTNGRKTKTVNFITGDVSWRNKPPSVAIRGVEKVLKTLAKMDLTRFIRTKEEVNKEAILAEPLAVSKIAGITISRDVEEFVITPFEQDA